MLSRPFRFGKVFRMSTGRESMAPHTVSDFTKAVFLDRDGVLIACVVRNGRPYPPLTLEQVEILPGVAGAVRQVAGAGYVLVGGRKQPDVGRGTTRRDAREPLN